jgi:hypothetical protein
MRPVCTVPAFFCNPIHSGKISFSWSLISLTIVPSSFAAMRFSEVPTAKVENL